MRHIKMPVIIRERRRIGDQEVIVKVYKSDRGLITHKEKEQAENLDRFLQEKMREVEREMKESGLLGLKGKSGVLKLWYEIGKRLSFVMDETIVPQEDRKYIWQALRDHAGDLHPAREREEFRYCVHIAKFDWDLVKLSHWTSWVDFFDRTRIREDPRIIEWLLNRSEEKPSPEWVKFTKGSRQDWIRKLVKPITHRFKNRATTELTREELYSELDQTFDEVLSTIKAPTRSGPRSRAF